MQLDIEFDIDQGGNWLPSCRLSFGIGWVASMGRRNGPVLVSAVAAAIVFCGGRAIAHHAFAATYIHDKTITIEGRVVEFLFRNPHSVVFVVTSGDKGPPVTWAADWGGGGQLSRQGIEENTIKPGDHVIISGNPSRNPADHRMRMLSLTRPSDGWEWRDIPQ